MVAKSEAGGAAASYFRVARPLPSLVTVLVLGYFGVRCVVRRGASVLARRAPVEPGALGRGKEGGLALARLAVA